MPLDWDLRGSDELGYSIFTDIGQFGAVMFEVLTGRRCKFDVFHDWQDAGDSSSWPPRDSPLSTEQLWLGYIIEKCWTEGYSSTEGLVAELERSCQAKVGFNRQEG